VLAQTGTATIVSAAPPARGEEQRAALRQAFAIVAAGGATARPLDWMETSTPERWQAIGAQKQWRYRWSGAEGSSAFLSP
jgi:alpha-galactosidase